jgi:hypothetical protein
LDLSNVPQAIRTTETVAFVQAALALGFLPAILFR